MKHSKMPRRSGKKKNTIPSLPSFHCRSSRVLSCLRSQPSITHVQTNSLCLNVSKTSHLVHRRRRRNANFPSCIQSMGRMGNGECERVTTPGVEIIPQLLPGIWCINTALEKHYSKSEGLHYCTTQSLEIPIDRGGTTTMNMTIFVI